jgi:hypothetical protein
MGFAVVIDYNVRESLPVRRAKQLDPIGKLNEDIRLLRAFVAVCIVGIVCPFAVRIVRGLLISLLLLVCIAASLLKCVVGHDGLAHDDDARRRSTIEQCSSIRLRQSVPPSTAHHARHSAGQVPVEVVVVVVVVVEVASMA